MVKLRTLFFGRYLILMALAPVSAAMPIQQETIKSQKNLTIALGKHEFDQCATNLIRQAQTLTYTCQLDIPVKSKNTRLQVMTTPKKFPTTFAGLKREVQVEISPDARVLSLTTSFDATGLDLELSKFNDDFYAVYAQAAHTIISDALKSKSIKMEVLESKSE